MKFTALIRETVARDLRVVLNADSKGQAKRILTSMAAHDKYKESIVVARKVDVSPLPETISPLTAESFGLKG